MARNRSAVARIDDVLVFELVGETFSLVGGTGRGETWAGIVEADRTGSIVARAWRVGTAVRMSGDRPVHVVGPYYAREAAAVPVGDRHVVVFGGSRLDVRDAELVRMAAAEVGRSGGIPADKLLGDELELVHALRSLMDYRPETVRETARHIAGVAAAALSCEVAGIEVRHGQRVIFETVGRPDAQDAPAAVALPRVEQPTVEQAVEPDASTLLGVEIVSRMVLPVGSADPSGALVVGHAATNSRGFTSLCQRIGRAISEAAELLLTQAATRESLAAERDLLARASATDPLTGTGNRRAWDDAVAALRASAPRAAYLLYLDVDGLKDANDRYGHAAGDGVLRAVANLLRSCVRDGDLVVRSGGDEFVVVLWGADARAAIAVRRRIRRAERITRITEFGLVPRFSMGGAAVERNDLEAARALADQRMYRSKRRRAGRAEIGRASRTGVAA
jgi:diguanylate cyclase (GGDEF)-like protein